MTKEELTFTLLDGTPEGAGDPPYIPDSGWPMDRDDYCGDIDEELYQQLRLRGAITRGYANLMSISGKRYAYHDNELFRLREL